MLFVVGCLVRARVAAAADAACALGALRRRDRAVLSLRGKGWRWRSMPLASWTAAIASISHVQWPHFVLCWADGRGCGERTSVRLIRSAQELGCG